MHSISWTINDHGETPRRTFKPSPPLAIKKIDTDALQIWVNSLIDNNLEDIGDMYWWEGHRMRTEIIGLICSFYDNLRNDDTVSTRRAARGSMLTIWVASSTKTSRFFVMTSDELYP